MVILPKIMNTAVCAALLGVVLISSGIIIISLRSWFLNVIIKSLFILKPSSRLLQNWQTTESTYTKFYFFNWTNYEDIFDKSKKPRFQEIGPYTFKEQREMVNLTWNNDNGTITYRQLRYWYFDEEKSNGKLIDQITTINPILMSAANQYNNWNSFMKREFLLSMASAESHLHVTKMVQEYLFEGYQDTYLDFAEKLPFLADTLPSRGKFGWFYGRNGSYTHDGIFNMATGVDNLGKLLQYNYKNELPFHSGACGEIRGSPSMLFPSRISQEATEIYFPEVCRYMKLDYEKDVISNNFVGYKHSAQQAVLDNGVVLPENKCYCDGECPPSGIFNISSCKLGIPAFASLPHFYGADSLYLSKVQGLRPEKSKHEMYITLEPKTGVTLSSALRLQFNVLLHPVENITLFKQAPTVFIPVLWFEQRENISPSFSSTLKVIFKLPIACTIIAIVEIVVGVYLLYFARRRHRVGPYHAKNTGRKNIRFEEVPLHNDMDGPYCSTTVDVADYIEVLNDDYEDDHELIERHAR